MQILSTEIRQINEIMGSNQYEAEAEMKLKDGDSIIFLSAFVTPAWKEINIQATTESLIALLDFFPDEFAYAHEFNRIIAAGIDSIFYNVDISKKYESQIEKLLDKVQAELIRHHELEDFDLNVRNYNRCYTKPYYSPEVSDAEMDEWDRMFYLDCHPDEKPEACECNTEPQIQILSTEVRETSEIMGSNQYEAEAEMKIEDEGEIVYLTALAYDGANDLYLFATKESLMGLLDLLPDKEAYAREYNRIVAESVRPTLTGSFFKKRYSYQEELLCDAIQDNIYEIFGTSTDINISDYTRRYVKLFYHPNLLEAPQEEIEEIKRSTTAEIADGMWSAKAEIVFKDGNRIVYLYAIYIPYLGFIKFDVTTESLYDVAIALDMERDYNARCTLITKQDYIESQDDICRVYGKFNKCNRYLKQFNNIFKLMDDAIVDDGNKFYG